MPSLGSLLTALVLRFEFIALEPSISLPVSKESELAPNAESKVLPTTPPVSSIKEAIASRVPISNALPDFPKPLFCIFLAGIFFGHVPAIIISTLLVYQPSLFDKAMHPILSHIAKIILRHLPSTWTIMWLPFLAAFVCLVREDGRALWKYVEVLAPPLAQPTVDADEGGEVVESLLLDAGLSQGSPADF